MLKEMPKNEGGWAQKQSKESCGTKTEPQEEQPPTYAELNIDKKDASKWQKMVENKRGFAIFFPFFVPLNKVLSPLSKEKFLLIMQCFVYIFNVYSYGHTIQH
ncbi:MAG: hypothetical protein HW390_1850 [Candidatus Brocadiaceae bacterium]|nr:hypothetical protein [Candidatus Brocadiaceae bacterium]